MLVNAKWEMGLNSVSEETGLFFMKFYYDIFQPGVYIEEVHLENSFSCLHNSI